MKQSILLVALKFLVRKIRKHSNSGNKKTRGRADDVVEVDDKVSFEIAGIVTGIVTGRGGKPEGE